MILSYFRTILLYALLLLSVRLMGKRQLGQMEPSEFVVTMLVANLAAIPMQEGGIPLFSGFIPIITVLACELVLSALSLKNIRLRKFLCGKPTLLMEDGRVLRQNLDKTRVTLDELTCHLRCQGILDLTTVQYAILETNGSISVFPYPKHRPATAREAGIRAARQSLPLTIISDGHLLTDNLQKAGKDRAWLEKVLRSHSSDVPSTWLLTVDGLGNLLWYGKEGAL